jgi:putative hydrolase of HD superfamily
MHNLLNFFVEIGKLKKMPRRGWVLRDIENPESIAEHSFRVAVLAWFLAREKGNLDLEKIIKMALIHDICEVYAGDITPYDSLLPKDNDKNKIKELIKTWPRFSEKQKKVLTERKYKKEKKSLEKLVKDLPHSLKAEIMHLWTEYEKGHSKEGKFFRHADKIENFLQAMEYWQKNKNFPQKPYWIQAKELQDDPLLIEFIDQMDKKFHKKTKPRL